MTDPIEAAIQQHAENVSHAPNAHSRQKVLREMRSLVSTVQDAVLEEAAKVSCPLCKGGEPVVEISGGYAHPGDGATRLHPLLCKASAIRALKSKDPTKR